jgi:hypothetical protein
MVTKIIILVGLASSAVLLGAVPARAVGPEDVTAIMKEYAQPKHRRPLGKQFNKSSELAAKKAKLQQEQAAIERAKRRASLRYKRAFGTAEGQTKSGIARPLQ